MQKKVKVWVIENVHLLVALIASGLLFHTALTKDWSIVPFLLVFLLVNFYFLKGSKLIFSTFFAPLPFFLLPSFFSVQPVILTGAWIICMWLLWRHAEAFWTIYLFAFSIITQMLLGELTAYPFVVLLGVMFVSYLTFIVPFHHKPYVAAIKSIIVGELQWLAFLIPAGFLIRSICAGIFWYWLLKQRISSHHVTTDEHGILK